MLPNKRMHLTGYSGLPEPSTWATPTIVSSPRGDELVTNGTTIRAYSPRAQPVLVPDTWTGWAGGDMPFIKDGAILVSASSKAVEFALADFEGACTVEKFSDVVWRFTQPNNKRFFLLLQGTPVNFRDGSILGTILDMIYCELFVCMREVAAKRAPIGLSKSPGPIQDEVAKAWLRAHSEDFPKAIGDKIWDYPESLKLGLPKPVDRI